MVHDQDLLDRLSAFQKGAMASDVFRATRASLDPLAPSTNGGRWAPVGVVPILYTSLEREGALAELAFHWGQLNPPPSKPAVVHRIRAITKKTMRLTSSDLQALGVNMKTFGGPDMTRTQEIGAACAFLSVDGLIVPSARWQCENLIIFPENHDLGDELAVKGREEIEWRTWAQDAGMLKSHE